MRVSDEQWLLSGLGTKPDAEIASKFGVSRRTVGNARKRLGILAFTGIVLTQEGLPCRSVDEAKFDAWLHWQKIDHLHEQNVPDTSFRADFYLTEKKLFIEIAGMVGYEKYNMQVEKKITEYDDKGVSVEWFSGSDVNDLYESCPLPLIFRQERVCGSCKKICLYMKKGLCKSCYMLTKFGKEKRCDVCRLSFLTRTDGQQYCSKRCYGIAVSNNKYDWCDIQKRLIHESGASIARSLGVNIRSFQCAAKTAGLKLPRRGYIRYGE